MSLMAKLAAASTIKGADTLDKSVIYNSAQPVITSVPTLNIALSGKMGSGLLPGLLMLAAPSKHFKSAFMLFLASQYLKTHKDGVILFYDSEFGTPQSYFDSFGIAQDRVFHSPISSIEQFRTDLSNQLENIGPKDNVFIMVDSIGNLASKKEIEDAQGGNDKADFTRAKVLKSTFRIATPYLKINKIPMVVINHVYDEIAMFPRKIVSGGTGAYYSADDIWIIGRRQQKDTKRGVFGYEFVINIEKSRTVQEKSQFIIEVSYDKGINKWSGLFDIALTTGHLTKVGKGAYNFVDPETGEVLFDNDGKNYSENDVKAAGDIWKQIISQTSFAKDAETLYKMGETPLILDEEAAPVD